MGHERRIAEGLMDRFLLTEEEAYAKANLIEMVEDYGDQASDTVYYFYADADQVDADPDLVESLIRDLRQQCHNFANAIQNLEAGFVGVEKRK